MAQPWPTGGRCLGSFPVTRCIVKPASSLPLSLRTLPTGAPVTINTSTRLVRGRLVPTAMAQNSIQKRVSIHTEIWGGEEGIFTRGEERLADLSVGGALIQGASTTTGGIRNIRSPHSLERLAAFVDGNS